MATRFSARTSGMRGSSAPPSNKYINKPTPPTTKKQTIPEMEASTGKPVGNRNYSKIKPVEQGLIEIKKNGKRNQVRMQPLNPKLTEPNKDLEITTNEILKLNETTTKPTFAQATASTPINPNTGSSSTPGTSGGNQKMNDISETLEMHQKIDKYFDSNESVSEYIDVSEATPLNDSNQDTDELKLTGQENSLRNEVLALCEGPDLGIKRHNATSKAFRALSYAKVVLERSTRTPAAIRREIYKVFEAVSSSILELEANLHHAEAKAEVLGHINDILPANPDTNTNTNQANRANNANTEDTEGLTSKPPIKLAQAIKTATTTLIIRGTDERAPEEVENQLRETTKGHQSKIKNLRRIRNGVSLQCESAQEAQELKHALQSNTEHNQALHIKEAGLKKKKIIIFNIPEEVTSTDAKHKLEKSLGVYGPLYNENMIQLSQPRAAREGFWHCPVLLPEPLADHLLNRKTICLGLKNCPVRNFVHITRCNRCLGYDHIAKHCRSTRQFCSICSEDHDSKDCRNRQASCKNCCHYNQIHNSTPDRLIYTDHEAHSGECWVYKTLLYIRQREMDEKRKKLTRGMDVIMGRVTLTWDRGVAIITRHTQADSEDGWQTQRRRRGRR